MARNACLEAAFRRTRVDVATGRKVEYAKPTDRAPNGLLQIDHELITGRSAHSRPSLLSLATPERSFSTVAYRVRRLTAAAQQRRDCWTGGHFTAP